MKKLVALFFLLTGIAQAQLQWPGLSWLHPKEAAVVFEEFMGGLATTGNIGNVGWSFTATNGTVNIANGRPGHPGVCSLATSATASSSLRLRLGSPTGSATGSVMPSDTFVVRWIFKLNQSDANTLCRIGLASDPSIVAPTNGIYFEKTAASSNWVGVCRRASVNSTTGNMDATETGWVTAIYRRYSATEIGFQINDGTEVLVSTNVPTVTLSPYVLIDNNANASNKAVLVDFFGYWMLTANR